MVILYILIYLIGWIWTWGTGMAFFQRQSQSYKLARKSYREDLGFTCFISLIPVTWFICIFYTGFYEFGWRLQPPNPKDYEL